jgi:ribosomal protein S18 acetylase RimI-like enzyme
VVRFVPLESGAVGRVLPFMSRLYEQDHLDYDSARAVRVCEWFLAHPEWGGIWTIESDSQDAGYVAATVASSIEFHGMLAFVDELYIAPEFRNRGLGPAAVGYVIEWARARGFAAVRLEVAHGNQHAQHVYRRAGFVLQDDRRLMTKWLTGS